ncbi:class I SAM-dependent methyltransferase [Paenibacillus senegalensis]|uniref:class I SAM-dependent methyltransferase n=1 Tax=Paenibacillus senegalensis TaxID=1465766 RepID=UPI0002888BCC|nr:class I SAM-dependent methyltransferase [Paenibacillus senegalensis]
MLVTTAYKPDKHQLDKAARLAERFGWTLVPRKNSSIRQLQRSYKEDELILVSGGQLTYYRSGSEPFRFHPSMAQLRIKGMLKGETDYLLKLLQLKPGDAVLDCTAGLGSDAIVFSYAVGEEGSVTALESEPVLAILVQEGLAVYQSGVNEVDEAMRRVRLLQLPHLDYLRNAPEGSVDVIYFDPMFRTPVAASDSLSPLRNLANPQALSAEAVREACRVARRFVVMKERRGSGEFSRLGFEAIARPGSKIAYGVIRPNAYR